MSEPATPDELRQMELAELVWLGATETLAADDVPAVAYYLWVTLTRWLAMDDWTAEQLCADVQHHVADENMGDAEGTA